MPNAAQHSIVLYDGVCGLCNRLNQFLLKRDRKDRLRFASLQSEFAQRVLRAHDLDAADLDTVYVVLNHGTAGETALARSDAIIHAVQQLGGIWKIISLGKLLPRSLKNAIYNVVARNRYRVFGKSDSCVLPEPRHRQKFIDV
jgi:predicted DCC family thiol-disulfide oxidoreductase YuxK